MKIIFFFGKFCVIRDSFERHREHERNVDVRAEKSFAMLESLKIETPENGVRFKKITGRDD